LVDAEEVAVAVALADAEEVAVAVALVDAEEVAVALADALEVGAVVGAELAELADVMGAKTINGRASATGKRWGEVDLTTLNFIGLP
jgi:hypothetical protein